MTSLSPADQIEGMLTNSRSPSFPTWKLVVDPLGLRELILIVMIGLASAVPRLVTGKILEPSITAV